MCPYTSISKSRQGTLVLQGRVASSLCKPHLISASRGWCSRAAGRARVDTARFDGLLECEIPTRPRRCGCGHVLGSEVAAAAALHTRLRLPMRTAGHAMRDTDHDCTPTEQYAFPCCLTMQCCSQYPETCDARAPSLVHPHPHPHIWHCSGVACFAAARPCRDYSAITPELLLFPRRCFAKMAPCQSSLRCSQQARLPSLPSHLLSRARAAAGLSAVAGRTFG